MTGTRRAVVIFVLTCGGCLAARMAAAGGPLIIAKDGKPRRWGTASPLELNLDPGQLGSFSSPQGLMAHAVAQWNAVPTSALKIEIGAPLRTDVEDLSASQFDSLIVRDDGTNPVIFDRDGDIFEALFPGQGDIILGVAGPSLVNTGNGRIVKGFAAFNGKDTSRGPDFFRAAMTHELGHLLNLEHSQINGLHLGRSVAGFAGTVSEEDVETMHPVLVTPEMQTLHADDAATLSALYPTPGFAAATGTILGSVLDFDAATPLQGVNVIARNAASPFRDAISYVTGRLVNEEESSAPAELLGAYEIRGLTAGASYYVSIEEVHQSFRGGASLGPLDPPLDLDPTRAAALLERYNGVNEAASNPPDDPLEAVPLAIGAGGLLSGVDIIFNGVSPRLTGIAPTTSSYLRNEDVSIFGHNFAGSVIVFFRGPSPSAFRAALPEPEVVSSSELLVTVPSGLLPGAYEVSVATARGESVLADIEYIVTEPPPTVSGTSPESVDNTARRQVSVLGTNLLGARSARLLRAGFPEIDLTIVRVVAADRFVVEVPPGLAPGAYGVQATNTAGTSGPSAEPLLVLELAPILAGEVDPPSARRSTSKQVRIRGENLAGTTAVELVRGAHSVPLSLLATSLTEVTVRVPKGLEPGIYEVRLTNSEGSVSGPSVFEVKAGGAGGGGGGCAAGGRDRGPGAALVAVLALLLVGILRRPRPGSAT